jgi:hypothetical protein
MHYSAPYTIQPIILAPLLTLLEPVSGILEYNDELQIQRDEDTLQRAGFITWRAPREWSARSWPSRCAGLAKSRKGP